MAKYNSMEVACKQVIDFMGIKQQAEKFGLGTFEVQLFRLEKIDGKAENYAIVTKAQLEMEQPFLGILFPTPVYIEFCPASGFTKQVLSFQ